MLEELTKRYREPHRKYHTLKHVLKMLDTADVLGIAVPDHMAWAIWCHDVIYDLPANPMENETESAEWCAYYMEELGFDDKRVEAAKGMILATGWALKDNVPDMSEEQWSVVGLDLYGFGNRCCAEKAAVMLREEFSHLSNEQWSRGRIQFLNKLLDRPYIIYPTFFENEDAYNTWHDNARENIERELEDL